MTRWQKIKKTLSSSDNYRTSVFFAIIFGTLILLGLAIYVATVLLMGQSTDAIFTSSSDWFKDLIFTPALLSRFISGSSYLGRIVDGFSLHKKKKSMVENDLYYVNRFSLFCGCFEVAADRKISASEKWLTFAGLIFGIVVGFLIIANNNSVPFSTPFSFFADIIYCFGTTSIFAGLGNRLGSIASDRKINERWPMFVVALLGIGGGTLLFLSCSSLTTVITITGVSALLSASLVLPGILPAVVFILSFASLASSFTDYFMRTSNFLANASDHDRYHEYRGAACGAATGLLIGLVILLLLGAFSNPAVDCLMIGTVIIFSCVSILGSLFSRVGRLIDTWNKATAHLDVEAEQKPALTNPITSTLSVATDQANITGATNAHVIANETNRPGAGTLLGKVGMFAGNDDTSAKVTAATTPNLAVV